MKRENLTDLVLVLAVIHYLTSISVNAYQHGPAFVGAIKRHRVTVGRTVFALLVVVGLLNVIRGGSAEEFRRAAELSRIQLGQTGTLVQLEPVGLGNLGQPVPLAFGATDLSRVEPGILGGLVLFGQPLPTAGTTDLPRIQLDQFPQSGDGLLLSPAGSPFLKCTPELNCILQPPGQ